MNVFRNKTSMLLGSGCEAWRLLLLTLLSCCACIRASEGSRRVVLQRSTAHVVVDSTTSSRRSWRRLDDSLCHRELLSSDYIRRYGTKAILLFSRKKRDANGRGRDGDRRGGLRTTVGTRDSAGLAGGGCAGGTSGVRLRGRRGGGECECEVGQL